MSSEAGFHNPDEEHWLFKQRMLWPGQFGDPAIFDRVRSEERDLLKNKLLKTNSLDLFEHAVDNLSRQFKEWFILDEDGRAGVIADSYNYSIFLPYSNGILKIIKLQPTPIVIFGDWGSGKTNTGWSLGFDLWRYLKEFKEGCEMHVYGDADAITETIIEMHPEINDQELTEFSDVLSEHFEFDPKNPDDWPQNSRRKILYFNEGFEAGNSRRGMSSENLFLAFKVWKVRHESTWPIFNVIKPSSIDSVIRESPVKIIHRSTYENMAALVNVTPQYWRQIIELASSLRQGQTIAIYSLLPYTRQHPEEEPYTTAIDRFNVDRPSWMSRILERAGPKEPEHALKISYMVEERRKKKTVKNRNLIEGKGWRIHKDIILKHHSRLNIKIYEKMAKDIWEDGIPPKESQAKRRASVETFKILVLEGGIERLDKDGYQIGPKIVVENLREAE